MERFVLFLVGFIIAGLIGYLSSLLIARGATWSNKGKKRQWSSQTLFGVIGLRVILQMMLLVSLLVSICAVFIVLQNEWLLVLIVGVFFSAVFGVILQYTRLNWKVITNSLKLHLSETSETSEAVEKSPQPTAPTVIYSIREATQRKRDLRIQIETKARRLQKLKEQQAYYGKSVDPRIPMEIEDIEAELRTLNTELKNLEDDPNHLRSPDNV